MKDVEEKIPGYAKYITIQEFNKLTAETFAERLKQVKLNCFQKENHQEV